MQNSRPVAYFLLVDFGVGFGSRGNPRVPAAFRVTGEKQSQLLVLRLSLQFDNSLHDINLGKVRGCCGGD